MLKKYPSAIATIQKLSSRAGSREFPLTMSQNPKTLSRIHSIREEHKLILPLLFEVNMKGRRAIPHIRHQAEYNLVINPTKQRKYPFPYRRDVIYVAAREIGIPLPACLSDSTQTCSVFAQCSWEI